MKTLTMGLAAAAVFALSASAWAQAVNTTCPVKGQAAKPNITTTYKGKVIGFC